MLFTKVVMPVITHHVIKKHRGKGLEFEVTFLVLMSKINCPIKTTRIQLNSRVTTSCNTVIQRVTYTVYSQEVNQRLFN